jgi:hypothetical protein
LPQAIATGDFSNVFQQAALGGATSAAGTALSSALSDSGFTPKQVQGAFTIAAQLASGNVDPRTLVSALGDLSGHPDADIAARAARTGIALSKVNPSNPASLSAVLGELTGLGKAIDNKGIKRLPGTTQGPTTSVTGGDLQGTGLSNVDDLLSTLPGVTGTLPSVTGSGAATADEIANIVANAPGFGATTPGLEIAPETDDELERFLATGMEGATTQVAGLPLVAVPAAVARVAPVAAEALMPAAMRFAANNPQFVTALAQSSNPIAQRLLAGLAASGVITLPGDTAAPDTGDETQRLLNRSPNLGTISRLPGSVATPRLLTNLCGHRINQILIRHAHL